MESDIVLRAIIIDDEPMAIEVLFRMLLPYHDIQIVGTYTDPIKAFAEIKTLQPDIVFLDIEMGEINGLEFAETLAGGLNVVDIVFITAYSQYAVEAFELNAIDYLLKPVLKKRLEKTLARLRNRAGAKVKNNEELELKVKSFGSFQVFTAAGHLLVWRTRKVKELFAFLWINKIAVPKTVIIDNIFPDRDLEKAQALLHTTIYQLRKALEKYGYQKGVIYQNNCYSLNLPFKSDAHELDILLQTKGNRDEVINRIFEIYKGDLFEEEGYLWVIGLQQNYKEKILRLLLHSARIELENNNINPRIKACLDKICEIEPFNEECAKMMIKYYGIQMNRNSLKIFFKDYEKNLREEMGLQPMKSTVELYRKYMTGK